MTPEELEDVIYNVFEAHEPVLEALRHAEQAKGKRHRELPSKTSRDSWSVSLMPPSRCLYNGAKSGSTKMMCRDSSMS